MIKPLATPLHSTGILTLIETRSVTMNFFSKKKYFLFKSFVKNRIKLSFHNKNVQYN